MESDKSLANTGFLSLSFYAARISILLDEDDDPESAVGRRDGDTIMPVYRDTTYWETENGMELQREMLVGDRVFLIRSVFPNTEKAKTSTQQMLRIIDKDIEKGSI